MLIIYYKAMLTSAVHGPCKEITEKLDATVGKNSEENDTNQRNGGGESSTHIQLACLASNKDSQSCKQGRNSTRGNLHKNRLLML